jgi:predicted MFS family arabinose efflux permease
MGEGGLWYLANMRSAIWIGIFIGSTIGGLIPELWGGDMLSYSGVLLSAVGAYAGLWLGSRASR